MYGNLDGGLSKLSSGLLSQLFPSYFLLPLFSSMVSLILISVFFFGFCLLRLSKSGPYLIYLFIFGLAGEIAHFGAGYNLTL